jgi:hypothetical protein
MTHSFDIDVTHLQRKGHVVKTDFDLTLLKEGAYSVSVERVPLTEYFVFFDHPVKANQIKVKLYKTEDGRWYDKHYSEEAELNTPEFGIPQINPEIKKAIDIFENHREKINNFY